MKPLAPPTDKEVLSGQMESVKADIKDTLAHDSNLGRFKDSADELLSEYTPEQLVQIYLSSTIKDAESVPVKIAPERPLPGRKQSHSRSGHGKRQRFNRNRRGGERNEHRGGGRRHDDRRRSNGGSNPNNSHKRNDNKKPAQSKKSFKIRTNL